MSTARTKRLTNFRQVFTRAQWLPTLFINFRIDPELVKPFVPPELELDLFQGSAAVSLVTVAMCGFRACRPSLMGYVTNLIEEQRFLNLRTYVKWRDEPAALFLHGWLSQPLSIPLPSGLLGLPYDFADSEYNHRVTADAIEGRVSNGNSSYEYRGKIRGSPRFEPCPPGSLAEFAMERYAGFFFTRGKTRVFRVWHPPWLQIQVEASISDMTLIEQRHSWIKEAYLTEACLTQELTDVWLGSARSLADDVKCRVEFRHHRSGALFEMP